MSTIPTIIDEYVDFLRRHRALAEDSIRVILRHVTPFLLHLGDQAQPSRLKEVSPGVVHRFVVARAESQKRTGKRAVCFAMRSFLRYASMRGYVGHDILDAVPRIPTYALAGLPRALPWADVMKILEAIGRSTVTGPRDYAILLLLATYGLRVGEVARMTLGDIDWRHDRLTIPHRKADVSLVLPLTPEVGEAMVTYLRESRPRVAHRQVFLGVKRPHRPFSTKNCAGLRVLVKKRMLRAGVDARLAFPHALRHSLASRMLQQGQPMKAIADVLGHASLQSTAIYAKVDIEHLRGVALDLPEVRP